MSFVSTGHDDRASDLQRIRRGRGANPLARLLEPMEWAVDAACVAVDPDLFFPERGESTAEAKAVCRSCPVRAECLDFALRTNETEGIWGGLSGRERRRMRSQRKAAGLA